MKSISSSIVVLAGIYGMNSMLPLKVMTSSAVPYFGFLVSLVVVVLGLIGWWTCLKYDR